MNGDLKLIVLNRSFAATSKQTGPKFSKQDSFNAKQTTNQQNSRHIRRIIIIFQMDVPADSVPLQDTASPRLLHLAHLFENKYGEKPSHIARLPGRVNLIGEHIDYCGYAVFPMAVEQDVLVAFKPDTDPTVTVANVNSNYPDFSCGVDAIKIDKNNPVWYNYFLCGVQGIVERINPHQQTLVGMKALVSGSVPPSAGLSSSSALVCAAALSMAQVNNVLTSKVDMANLCAKCERYIGTEGGGMDQAIAFLAEEGAAKLIEFNPLQAHNVPLPPGTAFVVANSLADANKAATSDFNCRVMECRLATQLLAKLNGVDMPSLRKLGDLQKAMGKSLPDMAQMVREHLHLEPYTKSELCSLLGMTEKEIDENILSENTRSIQSFCLYQRALHVFEEAHRVWLFHDACKSGESDSAKELGRLMFDSHVSCRDLYQCSHPLLDRLVDLSKGRALGARLTGAGWGGCMVALVEEDKVAGYIEYLKENYYSTLPAAQGREIETIIFPTRPGGGATLYKL